ncbi:MAG: hypothetical protein ACYC5H_17460 [Methylovirgula sp.]
MHWSFIYTRFDPAIQALDAQERKAVAHVVIARSEATRQSSAFPFLDCFAEPAIGQAAG